MSKREEVFGVPNRREARWLAACAMCGGVMRVHTERANIFVFSDGHAANKRTIERYIGRGLLLPNADGLFAFSPQTYSPVAVVDAEPRAAVIVWHGKRPTKEILTQTTREVAQLLEGGLAFAGDLCFHTIIDAADNPVVHVWGVSGDDRFHAEYTPNARWVTAEGAAADARS